MSNSIRKWYLSEALASYRRLDAVIDGLTLEEVMAALELESASQRRRTLTDKLISRAVRLEGIKIGIALSERFHHGKSI